MVASASQGSFVGSSSSEFQICDEEWRWRCGAAKLWQVCGGGVTLLQVKVAARFMVSASEGVDGVVQGRWWRSRSAFSAAMAFALVVTRLRCRDDEEDDGEKMEVLHRGGSAVFSGVVARHFGGSDSTGPSGAPTLSSHLPRAENLIISPRRVALAYAKLSGGCLWVLREISLRRAGVA
ncbi:hypothetical protein DEO72_LG10g1546 [Vigna unguiculata]|uniref:Uncharacterized protein n=1 Tax=Vigna unguiculata TaxID=3917 RepID=A0A4D6NAJ6_VIGUN|nr:hypothetical protein DEO72_LG10g1546 [Vigna unguiculata]